MFTKYLKQNLYLMQNLGKTFVKCLDSYKIGTSCDVFIYLFFIYLFRPSKYRYNEAYTI